VARFTRTLSTLVSSGVPILDSLLITAKTAGNKVVERAVLATRVSISEGNSISDPLTQSKVFPPMVCQMIAVGESTGSLDAMLTKIAEFYEDEVDQIVNNLTTLMEPIVILVLGVIIGGLVIFLVERYVLFSAGRKNRIHLGRVHHRPYRFGPASVERWSFIPAIADGFRTPTRSADHIMVAENLDVEAWPIKVDTGS
jgi:hypothetical protein